MKRYRVAQNEWNLMNLPWTGAVGIEEIDDGSPSEVPSVVAWTTRGSPGMAERIAKALNALEEQAHG